VHKKLGGGAINDECQKHHAPCEKHKLVHLVDATTLEEHLITAFTLPSNLSCLLRHNVLHYMGII
jgi:hypothetical protein